jgi:hypothetical protein
MLVRSFAGLSLLAGLSVSVHADDKLKSQAADAMTKSEVKEPHVVETSHLVVATALPEAKTKSLANALEKVYLQATKALKFDANELKGQMTVFVFSDLDNFRQFQRSVIKERPDESLMATYDVKRDDPYVIVSAKRGDKNPNYETIAGTEISRALLAKKGGAAKLTEWMKDGFATAVTWRLNPGVAGTDRSAVRSMAPPLKKGAKGVAVVDKAWTGTGREKEILAASLMDYFTSGTGAEKFGNVLNAMLPSDAMPMPTFLDALKANEWMVEDLDRSWREWVAKGSPAAPAK